MNITQLFEKAFLDGYATEDLTIVTEFFCIAVTAVLGMYIFLVYRMVAKKHFYNRNFNLALVALTIITAAVILTIQSNIVVSLGMVGALSIVRFRTAVKDPLDLVFLFWSLSSGIICGAGYVMIAVIAAVVLTIVIVLFSVLPAGRESVILVVNAEANMNEEAILDNVFQNCDYAKVRARNITRDGMNMAIEIRASGTEYSLVQKLMSFDGVLSVSLVEHDGDILQSKENRLDCKILPIYLKMKQNRKWIRRMYRSRRRYIRFSCLTIPLCTNGRFLQFLFSDISLDIIMDWGYNKCLALQFLDLMTVIDRYSEISGKELVAKWRRYADTVGVDFSVVREYLSLYPDKVYRNIYEGGLMGELV